MKKLKRILILILVLFSLVAVGFGVWIYQLNTAIKDQLALGWFKPSVDLYTGGEILRIGQKLSESDIAKILNNQKYRERFEGQTLFPNDFTSLDASQCKEVRRDSFDDSPSGCVYLRTPGEKSETFLIIITDNLISEIFIEKNAKLEHQDELRLNAQLFAQFYSGEPILRKIISIGEVPVECLQAVMAIEDNHFLEHSGVSVTGLGRALLRNIVAGRYAQGGSTLTQQLVKNYFLTSERTLKRKFVELFMAILLEANVSKDEILQNYLNIIYMGQNGPFQVVGISSAANHYFDKDIQDLSLGQCALLAAVINSPGRYNPFEKVENATTRRNLVLDKMVELNLITQNAGDKAKTEPLPAARKSQLSEPAPYFTQAVFREIRKLVANGILSDEEIEKNGLKVYTTLDPVAQEVAQVEVYQHTQNLEKDFKSLATLKSQGKNLEAALVTVDVHSGEILSLVGGRKFVKTQYNRILDAHRQVGSIMKPLVYLTALEAKDANGDPYNPLTPISDITFTHKYEGQSWTPKNYDKETYGTIPLYFGLKNSLNVSTAKLGIDIGLNNIIDVARRLGISSNLDPVPSLSLGAFELYPTEILKAYLTIARFGERTDLSFIRAISNQNDDILFLNNNLEKSREFPETKIAVLIGMMKETFRTGTARAAKAMGFTRMAAGKTGTTSDTKDAWFVGFTPEILTLVWVGYDDNTPSGLTGASGALPLWVKYMNQIMLRSADHDFQWPEGIEIKSFSKEELAAKIEHLQNDADVSDTQFVFEE